MEGINEEILRCKPWIMSAIKEGGDTHNFIDIVDGIVSGHMQLWPGKDGCAVTEIVIYPNRKVLHVFLAGGKLEQITNMHDDAVKWGKQQGCDSMSLSGRPGWKKILGDKGWKQIQIVLAKEF
jgi:hypothetical protein|tara:strand:+ start:179 stop:547 length:369 start_codon:yes stop_codon:yes gene_type:complete